MGVTLREIAPQDIEAESFRIIADELGEHCFDEKTMPIVQRVIHATGDFTFAENLRFSNKAIATGIKAIRDGKDILTDVTMVSAGVSKAMLAKWGGKTICGVGDPQVAEQAQKESRTRSEIAIDMLLKENVGIVAIGNAPTALVQAIKVVAALPADKVPLIIGVPVGFVNAAESKELLLERNNCYITSRGRKGGSPVAAAIVNALLRLAAKES